MEVTVVGISCHTAAVEVRERYALPGELAGRLLRRIRAEGAYEEALVLDTCNRTEIYLAAKDLRDPTPYLLERISELKGTPLGRDASGLYRHEGRSAVTHLFRVATALDSQIVGEHQILGQVKDAYRLALKERAARFYLNKLLHWAFRTGKRVRTETQLSRGSVSVAQAAVDLACQVFSSLAGKTVLLVGAGQTAELVARAAIRRKAGRIIVANRTLSRAQEVASALLAPEEAAPAGELLLDADAEAEGVGCPALTQLLSGQLGPPAPSSPPAPASVETRAIELGRIPEVIAGADLAICSTASPGVVLTGEDLGPILRRSRRCLFIVDIAVPRDVDAALGRLPNVYLYNLDDLDRVVARNIERRRMEVPRAEAIVADEVARFVTYMDSLEVAPTIKLLQQRFGALREAEIARYGRKFCPDDREQLEQFTKGLCSKILHEPIAFLRSLSEDAGAGDQLAAVDLLRRLFGLGCPEDDP